MNQHVLCYYAWLHSLVYLRCGYTEAYAESERVAYLNELNGKSKPRNPNTMDRIFHKP